MGKITKIKEEWDLLTKDAVTATNMGTTYGKMMGMRYAREQKEIQTREEERRRLREQRKQMQGYCRNCGAKIPKASNRKRFCCAGCEGEYMRKHSEPEEIQDLRGTWKPKVVNTCARCGVEIKGGRKIYCSQECHQAAKAEEVSLRKAKEKALLGEGGEMKKTICVACMAKLDAVMDLKETSRERFDKCQECGRKTIVKDFEAEVRRRK